jgi:hypothetical protein
MVAIPYGRGAGHFIASEANFWRSRDHVLITAGVLVAGTVLGQADPAVAAGMLIPTARAGNTGNGVLTPDVTAPVAAGAKGGVYKAVVTTAATNGGTFTVSDPTDEVLGTVAVGATFNNQVKFVIADGSADFVVGDTFFLTVTRQEGTYGILAPGGSGGIEKAGGILFDDVNASVLPQRAVAITREAEVDGAVLTWPAGITATQKATAISELLALGIVVR